MSPAMMVLLFWSRCSMDAWWLGVHDDCGGM
jgi:hypothetical protein